MPRLSSTLCLLLALLPLSAQAQQGSGEFQSWLTMVDYAKSKGVTPATWSAYESMCVNLKKGTDETAYNKCMFEKARDQGLYESDKAQCLAHTSATYPDSLLQASSETLRETDKDGRIRTLERIVKAIDPQELQSLRKSATIECMQRAGWANADNWKMGLRCAN